MANPIYSTDQPTSEKADVEIVYQAWVFFFSLMTSLCLNNGCWLLPQDCGNHHNHVAKVFGPKLKKTPCFWAWPPTIPVG